MARSARSTAPQSIRCTPIREFIGCVSVAARLFERSSRITASVRLVHRRKQETRSPPLIFPNATSMEESCGSESYSDLSTDSQQLLILLLCFDFDLVLDLRVCT